MILSVREKYIYVPKYAGNNKLPISERFSCEILRPTPEEAEELSSMEVVRDFSRKEIEDVKIESTKGDDRPKKTALRFIRHQNTGRILREHIGKCFNLYEEVIGDDGKKTRRAVQSGADLAESKAFGIKDLVEELCAEVLKDKIEEEEEKNSESASSST